MSDESNIGGMNVSVGADPSKFDREMAAIENRGKKAAKNLESEFNKINPSGAKFLKQSEEIKSALSKAKQEVKEVQKAIDALNKLGKIPSVLQQQEQYKQKLEQAKNK